MEPGAQRESPAGSGESDTGEWREEAAAGEAEEKPKGPGTDDNKEEEDKEDQGFQKKTSSAGYEEELDPRIQDELEQLNEASVEINKLELQLDDARSNYRKILTESARKLNTQSSQLGTCIEKARPYYEARRLAKEAQQEAQEAALRFERASSMHSAAREMVFVAEQGLTADGRNTLDPTWQEMLNHATGKVNEAEEERLHSEREHMRVTKACQEAEARVQTLQKSLKRTILKSKPYFELKAQFNHILEEHKATVLQLEENVSRVKTRYSKALRNLEQISEEIHAQRRTRTSCSGPRRPPVGAEAESGREGDQERDRERGACGGADQLDVVTAMELVERYRERERDRCGSDSVSVFSLQTIASDLERYDSVDHLGDLSDVSSVTGGEEREGGEGERGGGG
ncbi:unnamed protein product [Knipowitschia caucasica]